MDDSIQQSINEIGHNISCLHLYSGSQLDDVFRLSHLFPYSKFVNDMRGISINLGNFFSSYIPLLDSFHVAPVKPPVSEETVSYADKILVADLFTIGKSEDTLGRWRELKRDFNSVSASLAERENITTVVESHNELLQELVNRTVDFEKPQKHSEANPSLKLGVKRSRVNKDLEAYLSSIK
ncbi:hypothetical protein BgAZ_106380 [Babesia gibsoni]|uniref:Uncharacterized protein n=1 Tax=Babesia gibsoni TaxID=33632 RepID=A0AAD8UUE5_BABGI|nr:hypothetical protein BgAZ_106380 [Babesia gibsoni]